MSGSRRSRYVGVFLLGMFGVMGLFEATKPRIMVLQKDAPDGVWAREVDTGIRRVISANRRPIAVTWHYLGIDQKAEPAARVAAVHDARRALARIDPDMIITVDDETNALLGQDLAGLSRPKVVYVSIDVPPNVYGYDTVSNVSGVAERLPLAAACDAVAALTKRRNGRIAAVGADCDTARAEMAQVAGFDWSPGRLVRTALSRSWKDFRSEVERAGREADVLLVLTFHGLRDEDGSVVAQDVAAAWVEARSRALPLGLRKEFVAGGGGFALTSAGVEEGSEAMAMAIAWLDRPWLERAPAPVTSEAFEVMVRMRAMNARGVDIPPIYREAARAAGHLYP